MINLLEWFMALFSRSKLLIFGVFFIFALVPVASPTSFVNVAYADEGEGDAEGTGGTGAGSGGVGDINDGTTGSPSPSFDFLTVTTSCNENGTADASISFFFELYPPYHVLSMQILKDGAVVHTLGSYGATNPEGITSLDMHQPGISFTNFAAGSTYEVQVGDLAADFINTDTGPEINRWNFSQVASRTFGPLNCPAADLVGLQTAIYGYAVNDTRTVTPGALQFNSSLGNYGNANAGAFDVQVEVKNAAGTAGYSKFSSKFRSSGFSAYTSGWLAPIAFDGSALVPGGSYLARVCVDVDGEVPESNGDNNCGEWNSFSVSAAVTTCAAGQLGTYPNCVTPTWTTYCTGGTDVNHPWEWWRYTDDTSPRTYEPVRAGDGTCVAPTTSNPFVTTTCDADGRGVTLAWPTVVGASSYSPRVQDHLTNPCVAGWTWWSGSGSGGCYQDNITTTSTHLSGINPGTTYQTWVHATKNGVRDDQVNNSSFSCSATASPDLTVSGVTPTSAIAGTATTFSATVTNTGGGSTGIGFKNFYQVKSGTVGYTPQNFFTKLFNLSQAAETITDLTASDMAALAAGGSGTATQTYTFPAAGVYGIRVCADKENSAGTNGNPNGLIAESDETNNCGGWTDVNVTSLCTPSCGSGSVCSSGACVLVGGPCTPTNACGQRNSGTYNSSGVCSVSAPAMPPTYGNTCPSVPATNACGMPGSGTILCNGTCSAVTPSDTLCLPTITLSADPTRVRKLTSTKLTWTSNGATSCSLTGQNGFSSTALLGTAVDSTPLDAQTTFTLTCSNTYSPPSVSASVIVNLVPSYIEQ